MNLALDRSLSVDARTAPLPLIGVTRGRRSSGTGRSRRGASTPLGTSVSPSAQSCGQWSHLRYRVHRARCLDRALRLASALRIRRLLILHTREIAGPAEPRPGEPQRKSGLFSRTPIAEAHECSHGRPRGTVSTWHPTRRRGLRNKMVSTAMAGRDAPIARRGWRGTRTEHGRAYKPQTAAIGANPEARYPPETG